MRHPSQHSHHHHHHHHNQQDNDPLGLEKARQCEIHMAPQPSQCKSWLAKFPTRSKRIDVVSRITFPLVFALFNLVYWSTYLLQEEEKD
jgi:anionic glutamate receptor